MNILNIQDNKKINVMYSLLPDYVIKDFRQKLINLNIVFTNEVVYKIMNIVDEKTLFKIKNKAKNFQIQLFYMFEKLGNLNEAYKLLNREIQRDNNKVVNGQLFLFKDTELEQLAIYKKELHELYLQTNNKLISYESFINKQNEFVEKAQKKYKVREYKKEQQNEKPVSIINNFKDLNDTSLLSYIKQYERLVNKFKIIDEKTKNIALTNGEQEFILNFEKMEIESVFFSAKTELNKLENYYYKKPEAFVIENSDNFKRSVINFSKGMNNFNNKINMIEKTR